MYTNFFNKNFLPNIIPSFYDFFYLPITCIITIVIFLHVPYAQFILPTTAFIFACLYAHKKTPLLLWQAVFMAILFTNLYIHKRNVDNFWNVQAQHIHALSGNITSIKSNPQHTSALLQTKEGKFLLYWPHYLEQINDTSFVSLKNIKLTKPSQSFSLYVYKESIKATLRVQKQNIESVVTKQPENISRKLNKNTTTLLETILIGKKINNAFYTKIRKLCNFWGVRHYLARSGLHFSILLFILILLLTSMPIAWSIKQFFVLLCFSFFYIATIESTSFLRAFYFLIILTSCNILYIRKIPLHILNLTLCLILFYNPYLLFFLDFQLTFAATYILLWLNYLYSFHKIS